MGRDYARFRLVLVEAGSKSIGAETGTALSLQVIDLIE